MIRIKFRDKRKLKWFVIAKPSHTNFDTGWGNGYVKIPVGHPCYGLDYDTIHNNYDINVHGGLTYSDYDQDDKYYWVVGFDTAHYNDNIRIWSKERVEQETQELMNQLETLW
jgi:hypothetical protein